MRRFVTLLAIALPTPALATGGVVCTGEDVEFSASWGRLPVMSVLGAHARIAGRRLATARASGSEGDRTGESEIIAFGQGMFEPRRIAIDFTDENVERIVMRYRHGIDASGIPHAEGRLIHEGRTHPVRCDFE